MVKRKYKKKVKVILSNFYFPEYGISIKAKNVKEAKSKLTRKDK